MIKFGTIGISLVVCTVFGAGNCLAQRASQPERATPQPVPHATQLKRCEDVGQFAKDAAVARDTGESEHHFIGRLGLNMHPDGGLGLIHQRLRKDTRAPGDSVLVSRIFASRASPANWQQQVLASCEKNIG